MDTQLQSLLAAVIESHDHKGQRVDREDRSTAQHVIDQLLPAPDARSAVLQVLAELIEHAHTRGDRKWAITLFDRLARLNVGAVHVAVLLSNVLFLVVDPARIDDEARAALGSRLHRTTDSSLAAPAMELYLPADEVAKWWPKLRVASLASPKPEPISKL